MKRFKKWAKKGLALGAVVAMTATSIPMTGLNAEAAGKMGGKAEVEDGLVLHYNFESLKSGTIVNDLSGNGKSGRDPSDRFAGNDRGCQHLWCRSDCI